MKSGLPRRRGKEASIRLAPVPESVSAFEDFADGLSFLSERERGKLKLAGDEVLDNIIRHSAPLERRRIVARAARRGESPYLIFFFRSSSSESFAGFAAAYPEPAPLFDPARRRWRGMGLLMCRNLAEKVAVRHGGMMDRIILAFKRED
jgi:anti-sigma regulatory factor (Ser/Thr protein kinase)